MEFHSEQKFGADVQEVRELVRFKSGTSECVAWYYPGHNGACVVMAAGMAVTKEPGTDRFAQRFHEAGFSVVAFDHRGFGGSGGEPRQVASMSGQLADWEAAIEFATELPGVSCGRVAIWSFSLGGGHVLRLASRDLGLAAAIAQTPVVSGRAVAQNAARHQTKSAMVRVTGRAVLDVIGGLAGRKPRLVPLAGAPGDVALLTTPDSMAAADALNPDDRYPHWIQAVAARSALRTCFYRPERYASRVRCPLLVLVGEEDESAAPKVAARAARRAPGAELVTLAGSHYGPFLESHEAAVSAELSFLQRHLVEVDKVPIPSRPSL